jgi:hypothetical protein
LQQFFTVLRLTAATITSAPLFNDEQFAPIDVCLGRASGLLMQRIEMNRRTKREILYGILSEHGHSYWVVLEPNETNDANYVLCNFIKRRKAEVLIPDERFEDPRRYDTIGELITLAIDNSSPTVSQMATHELLLRSQRSMGL